MKYLLVAVLGIILSGCATPVPFKDYDYASDPEFKTDAHNIILTEEDITDRPYEVIKDMKVGFNKTSLFHEDPTKEHVAALLKHEAARIGADAVIFVRYGTVGIALASWGNLEGRGRAVKFIK